MKYPVVHHK